MMNALGAILRRPRTVLTLMLFMIVGGVMSYLTIPKEAQPDIDVPVFYVSVGQQGVSPEDAERLLVRPMETYLGSIDGLKEMQASASEGQAGILLEFDADFDKDAALEDVRSQVDRAKSELPDDADEPTITETNFNLVPTITIALSGPVPERTLYTHAKILQDAIEQVPTVLEANLTGQREELLEVIVDNTRLESYNISQAELLAAVRNNNQLVPAGTLDTGDGRFNIKVPGLFETAQDVMSLPVKVTANGDGVVTLGDLAEVRRTFKDADTFTRVNGQPAIAIEVVKRLGENIIENNAAVRAVVDEVSKGWPEVIRIDYMLDQSSSIFETLGSLQASILTAIALVFIVLLATLGLRPAILVAIAIPTSFMLGFLFLTSFTDLTLNTMVMFGLVLTVGMLVDSAIVITEYADRKMAEGLGKREAYIRAAQQMFWPVVSSTATTLAAFLPLLLWPGVAGQFMSNLPIMVIIVLSASLFTAMIFLPTLGAVIGPRVKPGDVSEDARALGRGSRMDPRDLRGATGGYIRLLDGFIGMPLIVVAVTLFGAYAIVTQFGANAAGVQFFVDEEPEQAVVQISARGNLSAIEKRDLVAEVEARILRIDGVEDVLMKTEGGGGGGGGFGQDKPADTIGQITLELEDYNDRRKGAVILDEIRESVSGIAGIQVELKEIEGGPPTGKDVQLQVTGNNFDQVLATTSQVRRHVETMEGLRDIEDSRPLPGIEWNYTVDRAEAGRYGTDTVTVGSMIQLATGGVLMGSYRPDDSDDEVDIRLRFPEEERSIDQIDQLKVRTPAGLVPIANFVTREAQPQVSAITRIDQRYAMTVKANAVPGVDKNDKVAELQAWVDAQAFPTGISTQFVGGDEDQAESMTFLMQAMVASLFLMFIILVTQFNSFYQALVTLSTVVMSVMGVLLGLYLTGQKFSIIMTGTGVIALAGIVVNNAIILIDTFNQMRDAGLAPREAMLKTAGQRIRPILLTTGTTIIGLVPMALQITPDFFTQTITVGGVTSSWWVQLATAIIFGLGFSTVLTLIVVPVLLVAPSLYKARAKRAWNFVTRRGRRARTAEPLPAPKAAPVYREAPMPSFPPMDSPRPRRVAVLDAAE